MCVLACMHLCVDVFIQLSLCFFPFCAPLSLSLCTIYAKYTVELLIQKLPSGCLKLNNKNSSGCQFCQFSVDSFPMKNVIVSCRIAIACAQLYTALHFPRQQCCIEYHRLLFVSSKLTCSSLNPTTISVVYAESCTISILYALLWFDGLFLNTSIIQE